MSKPFHRSSVMSKKPINKALEESLVKYSTLIPSIVNECYNVEDTWEKLVESSNLSPRECQQQFYIYEFIQTEHTYLYKIRVICKILLGLNNDGHLMACECEKIFGNINDVYLANDLMWREVIQKVLKSKRIHRTKLDPADVFSTFIDTDKQFKPYIKFCLLQQGCVNKLSEYSKSNVDFVHYLKFCEKLPNCNGMELKNLFVEPSTRMTRYPLILKKIRKYTDDDEQRKFVDLIIDKIEGFATNINTEKGKIFENAVLQNFVMELDDQDVWFAGNEEVIWTAKEFLRLPINLKTREEQRCLLKRGPMKVTLENRRKIEAIVVLFSDVLIITRQRKSNKKLTLIKQMFFLDKLILRKSEISNDGVLVVYKNEVGLLSEVLKLEIIDGSREKWCSKVEEAKRVYLNVRNGTGTTFDLLGEKYNGIDYEQRRKLENEVLLTFKRTSSWLLTGDSVTAIRKVRNKERASSHDSFRRAISNPNLLDDCFDELPDIHEDELPVVVDDRKKFASLKEYKGKSKARKKLSLDSLAPASPNIFFPLQRGTSTESIKSAPGTIMRKRSTPFSPDINNNEISGNFDSATSCSCHTNRINATEIEVQTDISISNSLLFKAIMEDTRL